MSNGRKTDIMFALALGSAYFLSISLSYVIRSYFKENFLRHFQSVSINESIMQKKVLEPNVESRKSQKMKVIKLRSLQMLCMREQNMYQITGKVTDHTR